MIKTMNISGMGGGYEAECQKMLTAGMVFIKEKGGDPNFDTNPAIFGVAIPTNKSAKALEKALLAASPDCTGAMFQAVVSHLSYIIKHGYARWISEAKSNDRVLNINDPLREKTLPLFELLR